MSRNTIVVASVICGDRYEEYMNFLKSAVMFTKSDIEVHAFMDDRAAHGIFSLVRISSSSDNVSTHTCGFHIQDLCHCEP